MSPTFLSPSPALRGDGVWDGPPGRDASPESPGDPNPTGQDSAFQGVERGHRGRSQRQGREAGGRGLPALPPAPPHSGPGSKQACCVRPPSCRSLAHAEPRSRNLNETPHQGGTCLYFSFASLCAKSSSSAVSGLAAPCCPHPESVTGNDQRSRVFHRVAAPSSCAPATTGHRSAERTLQGSLLIRPNRQDCREPALPEIKATGCTHPR